MSKTIHERVVSLVATFFDQTEAQVKAETSFALDMRADSLDHFELVMAIEDEFGITISDDEARPLRSVSDVVALVAQRCPAAPEEAIEPPLPTLTLGAIKERVGIALPEAFLASLGFSAMPDKGARLYQEADFPEMCRKAAEHLLAVGCQHIADPEVRP